MPPRSGNGARSGNTYGGGGRRPTPPRDRGRLAVITCLVVSLIATLGGIGVWSYAMSLNDDLNRMDAFQGVTDRPDNVGGLNILVLGSDSRNPDSTEGSRADTIIMAHIPENGKGAYLISLPRDLWVDIPANEDGSWGGGMSKLNAAPAYGGNPLTVQTIEGFTGVHLDHVLEIDFEGLKDVVDALGGITMDVQPAEGAQELTSIHTYKSQDGTPRTWQAGKQELDGESALDYVRQRKQFADGDFARMNHQQDLLMAMMDKATSAGIVSSPSSLKSFLQSVTAAVKVDKNFDLINTAMSMSHLRSDDLVFLTSPNDGSAQMAGQSVVVSNKELAGSMYEAIQNDEMTKWVENNPDAVKTDDSENKDGE